MNSSEIRVIKYGLVILSGVADYENFVLEIEKNEVCLKLFLSYQPKVMLKPAETI